MRSLNDLLSLGGIAVLGYVLYEMARRGDLGPQARELVTQIQGSTVFRR